MTRPNHRATFIAAALIAGILVSSQGARPGAAPAEPWSPWGTLGLLLADRPSPDADRRDGSAALSPQAMTAAR